MVLTAEAGRPDGNARSRSRALGVLGAAVLVLLAHGVDVAEVGGPSWKALAVRVVWAAVLAAHAVLALSGAGPAVLRAMRALSVLGSAVLFLVLVKVSGGVDTSVFAFAPVLIILMPIVLPERYGVALVGSGLLTLGTFAMLLSAAAPGVRLLAWGHATVFAFGVGWLFAAVHRRTQLQADAASQAQAEALRRNEQLVGELRDALASVKTLSGLLPVCAWCRRVRDDKGYWEQIEGYISSHSDATFSHGMCPDCFRRHEAEHPDES
jgi:hypothetical protein